MPIPNKLFICLKETCFSQQLAAYLEARHTSLVCLQKGKIKMWFLLLLLNCHHTRAVQAGGVQSTCVYHSTFWGCNFCWYWQWNLHGAVAANHFHREAGRAAKLQLLCIQRSYLVTTHISLMWVGQTASLTA